MKIRLLLILMFFGTFTCLFAQVNHGSVLKFDGVRDWVDIGDRESLNFNLDDFTISTWFKTTTEGRQQIIVRKGLDNRTANESRWVLRINPDDVISVSVDAINNFPGSTFTAVGEKNVADGAWHHVAAVFDRDQAVSVYLDGELEIFDDGLISQFDSIRTKIPVDVYIGRDNNGTPQNFFEGFLDEMRIWRKTLTEAQIFATMNDTLNPAYYSTADSGLVAYWRFDEDLSGEILFDESVNNNNGLVIGPEFVPVSATNIANEALIGAPLKFELKQNFPNPFNPETKIEYELFTSGKVEIALYNALGQKVRTLVSDYQASGLHSVYWNGLTDQGTKASSGTFFYVMKMNHQTLSRKLVMIK